MSHVSPCQLFIIWGVPDISDMVLFPISWGYPHDKTDTSMDVTGPSAPLEIAIQVICSCSHLQFPGLLPSRTSASAVYVTPPVQQFQFAMKMGSSLLANSSTCHFPWYIWLCPFKKSGHWTAYCCNMLQPFFLQLWDWLVAQPIFSRWKTSVRWIKTWGMGAFQQVVSRTNTSSFQKLHLSKTSSDNDVFWGNPT